MEQYATLSMLQNFLCKGAPQPSRSAEVIRIVTIMSAIAFPMVFLRLCSRYIVSRIWWDDWVIIVAAASMVPITASAIYCATHGFGNHVWDVPPATINKTLELYYIAQIFYGLAQNLAKISILLLFLRIFPGERFRLVTKTALVWMICQLIAFFIAVTLQCVPVKATWDMTQKGTCINAGALVTAGAGFNIFDDIVIILLPVRELKHLHLSLRKRVAVIALFALGSFACITSMVRLKYLSSYSVQSLDPSWGSVDIVVWSIIETYTAVICACLMTLRPLLAKFMPSDFQITLINSKSLGPGWNNEPESTVKLNSLENGKAWGDGKSSYNGGHDIEGSLEEVTIPVDMHDAERAERDVGGYRPRIGVPGS
ncbi:hypothetical protein V498_00906 [Pseudogymnoascus sp. VKM F-4517 (FW-2822)]|nr:hypothetical protein V498_00906 [Pseudogymnoascus sp. VKM F-4517 (FW-2822)]